MGCRQWARTESDMTEVTQQQQGITNKEKSLNPKHLPCWEKKKITLIHSFLLFLPRITSGFEESDRKQDQFFVKFQDGETLKEIVEM